MSTVSFQVIQKSLRLLLYDCRLKDIKELCCHCVLAKTNGRVTCNGHSVQHHVRKYLNVLGDPVEFLSLKPFCIISLREENRREENGYIKRVLTLTSFNCI